MVGLDSSESIKVGVDPSLIVERFGKEIVERYFTITTKSGDKKGKSKNLKKIKSCYIKKQSSGPMLSPRTEDMVDTKTTSIGGSYSSPSPPPLCANDKRKVLFGTNEITREIQRYLKYAEGLEGGGGDGDDELVAKKRKGCAEAGDENRTKRRALGLRKAMAAGYSNVQQAGDRMAGVYKPRLVFICTSSVNHK